METTGKKSNGGGDNNTTATATATPTTRHCWLAGWLAGR